MSIGNEVKFKFVPVAERYYNSDSSYGVFVFHTNDDIPEYDDVPESPFDSTESTSGKKMSILAGSMQQLYLGSEYEDMRIRFINWRDRECKIKCLCNHSYSINYLWYRDKEVCLKCPKCNKVKRIQLDDKTFETFCEVWKEECKNR